MSLPPFHRFSTKDRMTIGTALRKHHGCGYRWRMSAIKALVVAEHAILADERAIKAAARRPAKTGNIVKGAVVGGVIGTIIGGSR